MKLKILNRIITKEKIDLYKNLFGFEIRNNNAQNLEDLINKLDLDVLDLDVSDELKKEIAIQQNQINSYNSFIESKIKKQTLRYKNIQNCLKRNNSW